MCLSDVRRCRGRFSRCRSHHSHPGRVGGVQLPGGVPGRSPGAVCVAVGEEGRRHGRLSLTYTHISLSLSLGIVRARLVAPLHPSIPPSPLTTLGPLTYWNPSSISPMLVSEPNSRAILRAKITMVPFHKTRVSSHYIFLKSSLIGHHNFNNTGNRKVYTFSKETKQNTLKKYLLETLDN